MRLRSLAYTSLAALDLDEKQLADIHAAARDLNGLDGITGLLVFNGTHFLQWVEGPAQAIEDLVDRLRRDPRHSGVEIRYDEPAERRVFGHWSMELVRVRSQLQAARDDLITYLPAALPDEVRARLVAMVERISADVEL